MHFLGPRDTLDATRLAAVLAEALPDAAVQRGGWFDRTLWAQSLHFGFPTRVVAGRVSRSRARAPWIAITVSVPTHGVQIDYVRHRRPFQAPVRRNGEHAACGGPHAVIATAFDDSVCASLAAIARLQDIEIRGDRLVLRVAGWPADAASLRFVIDAAHAIAARVVAAVAAQRRAGIPIAHDPAVLAYGSGRTRSEDLGTVLLFVLLGVMVPTVAVMSMVPWMTHP